MDNRPIGILDSGVGGMTVLNQITKLLPYEEYIYGQIAKNQNELMNLIGKTTINEEKMKLFKEKFLNKCDGNSTKRFVEELILK